MTLSVVSHPTLNCITSLELLLRAEHVGVAATPLAAIHRPGMEPRIALSAYHLVAIVFPGEDCKRWLNNAATESEDQVQRGLLLDVVVTQCAAILELLACEDQALLVWWNTLLVLNLRFHIVNCV